LQKQTKVTKKGFLIFVRFVSFCAFTGSNRLELSGIIMEINNLREFHRAMPSSACGKVPPVGPAAVSIA
jgi:hypothetical protein